MEAINKYVWAPKGPMLALWLAVAFAVIGISAWGLGKDQKDTTSPEYKTGQAFMLVGVLIAVRMLIVLMSA